MYDTHSQTGQIDRQTDRHTYTHKQTNKNTNQMGRNNKSSVKLKINEKKKRIVWQQLL